MSRSAGIIADGGWKTIHKKVVLLFVVLSAMMCSPAAWADLSEPGPHQAGYATVTVTRPNNSTFDAILFYPATMAGQNAPYDGSGAPYPAISFGHGFMTPVTQYQSTIEHLATWGYFVVATKSAGGLFPNHADFAQDMRTCLTWLEARNSDSNSTWCQQVDVAHFGLSGHSMGGGASILAAAQDTRVRVVANMAAANTNPSAVSAIAGLRIPLRLLAGSDDSIVPPSGDTQSMYNNAAAPKQMPIILGGSHCGFLDGDIIFCDTGSIPRSLQLAITRRTLILQRYEQFGAGFQWIAGSGGAKDHSRGTRGNERIFVFPPRQGRRKALAGRFARVFHQETSAAPAGAERL